MDEQEQADRMAAAEALFMISTRGRKGKGETATRKSKRGRKKKEIEDKYEKREFIQGGQSDDEELAMGMGVKLKKQKIGQPDQNVTKANDLRGGSGRVRTAPLKKSIKARSEIDDYKAKATAQSNANKLSRLVTSRLTPKKRHNKNAPADDNENESESIPATVEEIQVEEKNKKMRKKKIENEIKAVGFTGMPVTISTTVNKPGKGNKAASPRRTPSTNAENNQPQVTASASSVDLKSSDVSSLSSTTNLLSMGIGSDIVNLPSLPVEIGSLQLPSEPVPNLSSLDVNAKRDEPTINTTNSSEESQKQLPLKKRRLLGTQQGAQPVEEEKTVEDVSDTEEEGVTIGGQVQATFTVQAPPIITMQTLMEIKTALTPDEDGDLPLHIAVVHENMRMVTKLINLMRIAVKGVDKFNKQQQTPLHLAVKLNFVPAVDLLITSGANINTVDCTGSSAIHMAVQGMFYKCLELILKRCPQAEINARNFEGLSPIHLAVSNKDIEQVKLLLKYGADIDLLDGKSGRTALFHAAETNQKSLVELLLQQGANPELPNYAGVTTTMAAQGRNLHSILKLISSVVLDKQENKWSCVKNQSGSVMELKQSAEDSVDGTTPKHSLHPPLSQLTMTSSIDPTKTLGSYVDQTKTYRNMLVISESGGKNMTDGERRLSPFSPPKTSSPASPSPLSLQKAPDVKTEISSNLSIGQVQGQRSVQLHSLPLMHVKQEVVDNSSTSAEVGSSGKTLQAGNKYVVVSKSAALHSSMIEKSFPGASPSLLVKSSNSAISGTRDTPVSPSKQISLLQQMTPQKLQQLHQGGVSTLSFPPSPAPSPSIMSTQSISASPRSPAVMPATPLDTVTLTSTQARLYKRLLEMYNINPSTAITAGCQSTTLSSPSLSSTTSSSSPPPPLMLKSLQIFPSTTSLSSPSPLLPSLSPSSSSSASLHLSSKDPSCPISGLTSVSLFPTLKSIQSSHPDQRYSHHHSFQRSNSLQDVITSRQTNSTTPPHRASALSVSEPTFRPHHHHHHHHHHHNSNTVTYSTHEELAHPQSQTVHPIVDTLRPRMASNVNPNQVSDVPLNLTTKNDQSPVRHKSRNNSPDSETSGKYMNPQSSGIQSTPVSLVSKEDAASQLLSSARYRILTQQPPTSLHGRESESETMSTSDKTKNKLPLSSQSPVISTGVKFFSELPPASDLRAVHSARMEKEMTTAKSLAGANIVSDFPHIAKSVKPETATLVRKFLSQQQMVQSQQAQKHSAPNSSAIDTVTKNDVLSSSPSSSFFRSSPKPFFLPSDPVGLRGLKSMSSLNIPQFQPIPSSMSSSLSSPLNSLRRPSSSLPTSPSSTVSTLPLSLSQMDAKRFITLANSVGGVVTVDAKGTPLSLSSSSSLADHSMETIVTDPSFLHQGRYIDLSSGGDDSSKSHDSKIADLTRPSGANIGSGTGGMEGKMVGFSGAIISIPNPVALEKEKHIVEQSSSDVSVKQENPLIPQAPIPKNKVKRKSRKGNRSVQVSSTGQGEPMHQNKINSETDQRLKKFLDMKRTEGTDSEICAFKNEIEFERNKILSNRLIHEEGSRVLLSNRLINEEGSRVSSENKPIIETVGIFSGNIQHVKYNKAPLKSNSKSTRAKRSSSPESMSPGQNTMEEANREFESEEVINTNRKEQLLTSDKVGAGDGTRVVDLDDNETYYSERIVWRSSPILPQCSDDLEIPHNRRRNRKSPKPKEVDYSANNNNNNNSAAVIVKPLQENAAEVSSKLFRMTDDSVDMSGSGEFGAKDTDGNISVRSGLDAEVSNQSSVSDHSNTENVGDGGGSNYYETGGNGEMISRKPEINEEDSSLDQQKMILKPKSVPYVSPNVSQVSPSSSLNELSMMGKKMVEGQKGVDGGKMGVEEKGKSQFSKVGSECEIEMPSENSVKLVDVVSGDGDKNRNSLGREKDKNSDSERNVVSGGLVSAADNVGQRSYDVRNFIHGDSKVSDGGVDVRVDDNGGDSVDVAMTKSNRQSVEEETALVIDLGTPTDNKSLSLVPTLTP